MYWNFDNGNNEKCLDSVNILNVVLTKIVNGLEMDCTEVEKDGRGVRGHTYLLPQPHQKKKSTCKTTCTEHQLNAGRRT